VVEERYKTQMMWQSPLSVQCPACPGHPRLNGVAANKDWMAGQAGHDGTKYFSLEFGEPA